MENFILIILCLTGGLILQHFPIFNRDAPLALNLYVIWFALPALILRQVPELAFNSDLLICVVMPWLMVGLGVILVKIGSFLFRWSRRIEGGLMLMVPLGNTSFLGIPMITAFFGGEMVPYGILYDQFGSFIALSTYGTIILAVYSSRERQKPLVLFRKIFTFPPFIALLLALIFQTPLQFAPLQSALQTLGSSLVPVVMFAIGLQLKIKLAPGQLLPFSYGLFSKLIIAPLVALLFCKGLGIGSAAATISIFEAGMPPMVTAGALAISGGLVPELVAALTGWGIVFSFFSLALLSLLL